MCNISTTMEIYQPQTKFIMLVPLSNNIMSKGRIKTGVPYHFESKSTAPGKYATSEKPRKKRDISAVLKLDMPVNVKDRRQLRDDLLPHQTCQRLM